MNVPWTFTTDAESSAACWEIVDELQRLFGVSREEAIGRINRQWNGQEIVGQDIVYHGTLDYWVHVMYYGADSFWWITGEKREKLKLGPILPKPFP